MASKYINNIKLHQKPFDKTIAINTRSGGLYYSGYATPIQNLSLGQVAVQFGIGDIISKINNKYAISRTTYNKANSQGL
jgi:hypothetical protein